MGCWTLSDLSATFIKWNHDRKWKKNLSTRERENEKDGEKTALIWSCANFGLESLNLKLVTLQQLKHSLKIVGTATLFFSSNEEISLFKIMTEILASRPVQIQKYIHTDTQHQPYTSITELKFYTIWQMHISPCMKMSNENEMNLPVIQRTHFEKLQKQLKNYAYKINLSTHMYNEHMTPPVLIWNLAFFS